MPVGLGYNPTFNKNDFDIPDGVSLIEIGLEHLQKNLGYTFEKAQLSLHIARSPISENKNTQNQFISWLSKKKTIQNFKNIKSIGFHLTGDRTQNIGRYGFSSYFNGTKEQIINVENFVKKMQDIFQKPIWLENINFYSSSLTDIQNSWKATEKIAKKSNASLIVDLSHLAIDLLNVSRNPHGFLSCIPWDLTHEIHLSGIIQDSNGAYHDNHSIPVHPTVWSMLETILDWEYLNENVFYTIEHTDPEWINKKVDLLGDLNKLKRLLSEERKVKCHGNLKEEYAKKYLVKIIEKRFPEIAKYMSQKGVNFNKIAQSWINNRMNQKNTRFLLTKHEIFDKSENVKLIDDDFINYVKEELCK